MTDFFLLDAQMELTKVIQWMKSGIPNTVRTLDEAIAFCSEIGGTLFGELDGTVKQLVYLLREPEIINIMFLGALYDTATASWITLRVIDITDKIIWASDHPIDPVNYPGLYLVDKHVATTKRAND